MSISCEKFTCESITLFSKIRSLYGEFRYTESRFIERRLHGKVWERKRDRAFAFVIEKIRYTESRYRERRL